MNQKTTRSWVSKLGYDKSDISYAGDIVSMQNPYAREINHLLDPENINASAVIQMDDMPVVCFIDAKNLKTDLAWLDDIRKKIWNQSLVSLVFVVDESELKVYPLSKDVASDARIDYKSANKNGRFSLTDIYTGEVQRRHPDWFDPDNRVDQVLLKNLKYAVSNLQGHGLDIDAAQFLMGQCLFVSYLEHRKIVSDEYRKQRQVSSLHSLISNKDGTGLEKLFKSLKKDFNGDFFALRTNSSSYWTTVADPIYELLDDFLKKVDLDTGQQSFWGYDFRYIPVEMISGIYEMFLGDDKGSFGAYYTPRHLANLTVDQALESSKDITKEVVFDGACGSGILLTTVYRRILSSAIDKAGKEISFRQRIDLLLSCIRGGDINQSACRVTAFSLYLALLEDIKPNDIVSLQQNDNVKLPELINKIIVSGEKQGDFFYKEHRFANIKENTIVISNPPWYEAKGSDKNTSFELWSTENKKEITRRQIACAYAFKSIQSVKTDGKVCLILPAGLFTASTSQKFISQFLEEIKIDRIINFSDVRKLLFAKAIHPCVVITGKVKSSDDLGKVKGNEFCDYWAPKADVSLAFGRLTVHGSDRHRILVQEIWHNNEILRIHFWGSQKDRALITKLRMYGQINQLVTGNDSRWTISKGFHQTDSSKKPLSTDKLQKYKFLETKYFPKSNPIFDKNLITSFPDEIKTVADYGSKNGVAFDGPRVLFPDGTSSALEVRASFTNKSFCFKQTISSINGPIKDESILRFLSVYLRSKLSSYLLFHTAYSLAGERPHVKLIEIKELPFVLPENHNNPKLAFEIIQSVTNKIKSLEKFNFFELNDRYEGVNRECEKLIFKYFNLSQAQQSLVEDTYNYMIPSVQPSGYENVRTKLYDVASENDLERYTKVLSKELNRWQEQLKGSGKIIIQASSQKHVGAQNIGIVKLFIAQDVDSFKESKTKVDDRSVNLILGTLKTNNILPMPISTGGYHLGSDFLVHLNSDIFLIKPLAKRLWLRSQAVHDAQRIVLSIQNMTEIKE